MKSVYDFVSPLDFRYYGAEEALFERLSPYVSENAFIKYQIKVERALILAFSDFGWCPQETSQELLKALDSITPDEVYREEQRTGHNIRALVNCVVTKTGPEAGRFVHLFLTSSDTTDTANALRFQELVRDVLLPDFIELQAALIDLAEKHADTPQIGRTHGCHAEPITFGFAMALYVDRLAGRIRMLEETRQRLCGKLSGAVGAYNSLALQLPRSAVLFEKLVLGYLGLQASPGSISSQVVQPEYLTDLAYVAQSCFSVLANLADDMRHLHRSEIAEVQEHYLAETVGSSTMPHKMNPKSFENVKSLWKAFAPRMVTQLMDQISEHQRDLTNSASQRFLPELFTALDYCCRRLTRSMRTLQVNTDAMRRNLEVSKPHIVAEPLYLLLALRGMPQAYERVRALSRKARDEGATLMQLARNDSQISQYLKQIEGQRPDLTKILDDPARYVGQAPQRARAVCRRAERQSAELLSYLLREQETLKSVTTSRFAELRAQIDSYEAGADIPDDLCPTDERRSAIEAWRALAENSPDPVSLS